MKLLITGSAGFIATNLIPKLANHGHQILGVDSLVSGSQNYLSTSHVCTHHFFDLNDIDRLSPLLKDVDVVFHLAAKGNVIESVADPLSNFQANTASTLSLLEAMRKVDCHRIIFSSTGGALMGNAIPPVNEDTLPRPISPYGASKLACEGYLSAYSSAFRFSSIVLRFGNVYGPFSSHKVGVINRWIRAMLENKEIVIFGDGSSSRDYIHTCDLTDGLLLALDRLILLDDSILETYHLANHHEITLKSLKNILEQCNPTGKPLNVLYQPSRSGEVERNFADITLAKTVLGFNPSVDFLSGISRLCKWIQANEFGC